MAGAPRALCPGAFLFDVARLEWPPSLDRSDRCTSTSVGTSIAVGVCPSEGFQGVLRETNETA